MNGVVLGLTLRTCSHQITTHSVKPGENQLPTTKNYINNLTPGQPGTRRVEMRDMQFNPMPHKRKDARPEGEIEAEKYRSKFTYTNDLREPTEDEILHDIMEVIHCG